MKRPTVVGSWPYCLFSACFLLLRTLLGFACLGRLIDISKLNMHCACQTLDIVVVCVRRSLLVLKVVNFSNPSMTCSKLENNACLLIVFLYNYETL